MGVVIIISDKLMLKTAYEKREHFIMTKGSVTEEDITFINAASNIGAPNYIK